MGNVETHESFVKWSWLSHLNSKVESILGLLSFLTLPGKTDQNLSVSSPAPVTMVSPEGFMARKSTRLVCPVRVVIFWSDGYFQTMISLLEYPWVLTIYLVFLENIKLHTCDPVSMLSISELSSVFQNLIVLSAEPPPLARTPWLWGLQANPFTAAQWLLNLQIGVELWGLHMYNLLSLPPEASKLLLKDHFNPQTSCVWFSYLLMMWLGLYLTSLSWIVLSLEPLAKRLSHHATELTRALWP